MALCKDPINLKAAGGIVPCGRCFTCRLNKGRFWTFRLMMEAQLSGSTWWTTLTYDENHVPDHYINPTTGQIFEHPQGCLNPRHIELFLKRVRKKVFPLKFRYFVVGEYGERSNRPHFHICIFGLGSEVQRVLELCWTDPVSRLPLGFIDRRYSRPLDTATARYTVGYTLKKLTRTNDYRLEGRYPEFISSSQGIGMEWAKRFADAMRSKSGALHIFSEADIPRSVRFDGRTWPLDRYLRLKILEHLGVSDVLLEAGQIRFKKEMRSHASPAKLKVGYE